LTVGISRPGPCGAYFAGITHGPALVATYSCTIAIAILTGAHHPRAGLFCLEKSLSSGEHRRILRIFLASILVMTASSVAMSHEGGHLAIATPTSRSSYTIPLTTAPPRASERKVLYHG
jgi:hypothetical protein